MKRFLGWTIIAALLVVCGCSEEDLGTETANEVPETVLSNAPPQGSTGSFSVDMNWYGIDDDGEVVGFYYAWDDTQSWVLTDSTEKTFIVSADSCIQCDHTDTLYFDFHTFWVKAVDDRGAHDPTPEHRTFTAESTAPVTTIDRGPCERNYCGQTGTNILFEWSSYDPDGGDVDSFFYKLNVGSPSHIVDATWTRVGADCTYVRFADVENLWLITGRSNSFAVVAKDNAGAMERVLSHGQNWCCFDPWPGQNASIQIFGGVLGSRDSAPEVQGGPQHVSHISEIFRGVDISFTWVGDASRYGANVVGYRYAVEDTTDWSTWYSGNTQYPADGSSFVPTVGNHVLYVQALDDIGTVSLCYFKYYVEAGPLHHEDSQPVLVVDDSQYSGIPTNIVGDSGLNWDRQMVDEVEGDFFARILEDYDFLEWDCQQQGSEPPPVSLVGLYRTVLWYVDDYDGLQSDLRELFSRGTRYLDSYVKVGGNVIMCGWNPALSLDADCRPGTNYTFRYGTPCREAQNVPISYSAFGLDELAYIPEAIFLGATSTSPNEYPDLPLGDTWPFYIQADSTMHLWAVEVVNASGLNAEINVTPAYRFNYFVAPGQDSQAVMIGEYCAVIVDNSDDQEQGSAAYFGWAPIWCDWDSFAAFMNYFLANACNEPPSSP